MKFIELSYQSFDRINPRAIFDILNDKTNLIPKSWNTAVKIEKLFIKEINHIQLFVSHDVREQIEETI